MKEVFVVTNFNYPVNNGSVVLAMNATVNYTAQIFQNKEFETHDEAVQYIASMLKYHDVQFQIQKVYKKNATV